MDVRSYQEALAALGHYNGKIDGLHGPLTIKAIKAFQTVNGLWPTGIMDVPTKAKLAPATTKLLYTPSEPRWMIEARKHVGLKEVYGRQHNPQILKWWQLIRAPFTDDETPWCAGYVGGVLESVGIKSTRSASARSYEKWGEKLDKPLIGAIVVFWRGSKASYTGHVGFYAGRDQHGNVMVLGGNQSDRISIVPFSTVRLLGYRWPAGEPKPGQVPVSVFKTDGRVSTNEA
jgi:uncharacterized protein (TIGR02594 family)